MTKASVIGAGRWGTFLAWYLSEYNRADEVCIYGLEKSKTFQKKSINQKILNKLSNIDNDILLTRTNLIKQVRILENKHNTQNKIVGLYDLNEVSYLELDAPQN